MAFLASFLCFRKRSSVSGKNSAVLEGLPPDTLGVSSPRSLAAVSAWKKPRVWYVSCRFVFLSKAVLTCFAVVRIHKIKSCGNCVLGVLYFYLLMYSMKLNLIYHVFYSRNFPASVPPLKIVNNVTFALSKAIEPAPSLSFSVSTSSSACVPIEALSEPSSSNLPSTDSVVELIGSPCHGGFNVWIVGGGKLGNSWIVRVMPSNVLLEITKLVANGRDCSLSRTSFIAGTSTADLSRPPFLFIPRYVGSPFPITRSLEIALLRDKERAFFTQACAPLCMQVYVDIPTIIAETRRKADGLRWDDGTTPMLDEMSDNEYGLYRWKLMLQMYAANCSVEDLKEAQFQEQNFLPTRWSADSIPMVRSWKQISW